MDDKPVSLAGLAACIVDQGSASNEAALLAEVRFPVLADPQQLLERSRRSTNPRAHGRGPRAR